MKDTESRWLVWSFMERLFAVELSSVFQVIEKAAVFRIPLVSGSVIGIIYYQEEAIPVVNPSVMPGAEQGPRDIKGLPELILLVEWNDKRIGIPVDRVIRVVEDYEIEDPEEEVEDLSGLPVDVIGIYSGKTLYSLKREDLFSALTRLL